MSLIAFVRSALRLGELSNEDDGSKNLPEFAAVDANRALWVRNANASGDITTTNPLPVNALNLGPPGTTDSFGNLVSTSSIPQLTCPFFQNAPASFMTVTPANGGTAAQGTSTQTGLCVFSTGTNVSGSVKAVTPGTVSYAPRFGIWATFSAIFTAPTSANTTVQYGLQNGTTDGLYFGYQGAQFGIYWISNSATMFIAQSSWNLDKLTGASGSLFTKLGVAQSLDPTKDNVYEIRLGWVGGAAIEFCVMSPDGVWTVVHRITYPNSAAVASLTTPNLALALNVVKASADAQNVQVLSGCAIAGITGGPTPSLSGALSLTSGQTIILPVSGHSSLMATFSGTWSGAGIVPQYSADGMNWQTDTVQSSAGGCVSSVTINQSVKTNIGGYKFYAFAAGGITGTAAISYSLGLGTNTTAIAVDSSGRTYTRTFVGSAEQSVTNPQFAKITDGSNGAVAVKAASTASAFGDIALTTDIRPGGVLPASAAPADAVSNATTVSAIGAWLQGFNGTAWDRIRSGYTGAVSSVVGWLNTLPFATYNSTAPTVTNGQSIGLQSDANGNLQQNLATVIQGEDFTYNRLRTVGGWNYYNFTTANTGYAVKAAPGILGGISINTPITSGTVKIYDNASSASTPIAQITLPATLLNNGPLYWQCGNGMYFANGLYFVSTGTNLDVTVFWI